MSLAWVLDVVDVIVLLVVLVLVVLVVVVFAKQLLFDGSGGSAWCSLIEDTEHTSDAYRFVALAMAQCSQRICNTLL